MKLRLTIIIIIVSMFLAACTLAEDITPPPNYSAATSQPSAIPATLTQIPIPTSTTVPPSTPATSTTIPNTVVPSSTTTTVEASASAQATVGTTPNPTGSSTTPAPETTATVQSNVAIVSGTVTVASGVTIPSGTIATLLVYDTTAGQVTQTLTSPILSDGKYEFSNIPATSTTVFLVTVEYSGVTYDSVPAHFDGTKTQFDMPITVYETTADLNVLTITQAHVQFDFSTAGQVQVTAVYIITNPGTNAVTVPSDGSTVPFIQIPAGAQGVGFQLAQSSSPLMSATGGFALLPGTNLQYGIIASFNLPYTKRLVFSQPFSLPVSSATIIVPEGVKVKSDQLTDAGTQGTTGTIYHLYSGSSLASGSTLTMTISGMPGDKAGFVLDQRTWLEIGVGALGVVLIGLGIFLFLRDRRLKKLEEEFESAEEDVDEDALGDDRESIMDAIIALDDQYKAGDISQEAYENRRAELKERLKTLV
jgi:hypothetical protein